MPGEATNVGSIVAYLIMNDSDWDRVIDAATVKARRLAGLNPTIKIEVDGGAAAIGELVAVDQGVKRVDDTARKAGGKGGGPGLLLTSILALGPALVPLAAAVAGFGIGAGAALGVAVLGFLGIKEAMKQGTTQGLAYRAAFAPVVGEFEHLKQLSAAGLFDGINAGARASQALFPQLNRDVAIYSSQLGQIVGHVAPALVAVLGALDPLLTQVGADLVGGAAKFQQWATSSSGLKNFVAYAQNQLPGVEHTLSAVAAAISHIIAAEAPLGSVSLSSIGLLARLINLIPINVLQVAAPAITGVVLAIKAMNAVNASTLPGLKNLSLGWGTMGPAALLAGGALAILTTVIGSNQRQQAQATAEVNSYVSALQASHGAIDQNIRDIAAKNLQDSGAFDAAKRLGIGLDTVTSAALGNKPAIDQVNAGIVAFTTSVGGSSKVTADQTGAMAVLKTAIFDQTGALDKATQKQQDLAVASAGATTAAKAQNDELTRTASQYGVSVGAYQAAAAAAAAKTAKDQQATATMILESDAAGLLKTALDVLNDHELSVAQTTTTYDSAVLALTKSLKTNGNTVAENTDKGVANRQSIEQLVSAAQAQAQAVADSTKSTEAGTAAYKVHGQAILDNIAKVNGDKTAADRAKDSTYQFAQTLLGLAKIKVPPTKVDVDKAAAEKKVADFKASLITIANYRPTTAIGANNAAALAKIKDVRDHLNDINGSVAYAYIDIITTQTNAANKRAAGSAHASGGQLTEGYNLINEAGPEILYKHGGTVDVVTAPNTKAIMSGASGGSSRPLHEPDNLQHAILATLQDIHAAVVEQPKQADRLATVRSRMGL